MEEKTYSKRAWVDDMMFELTNLMAGEFDGAVLPERFKGLLDEFEGIVSGASQDALDGDGIADLVPDTLVRAWAEYRVTPWHSA